MVLLAACGTDTPAEPLFNALTTVSVTVAVSPSRMVPGDTAVATVTVRVWPERRTLSEIRFAVTAMVPAQEIDLPVVGPGSYQYGILLGVARIPVEGEILIEASARAENVRDADQATLRIADDGPPLVVLETLGSLNATDRIQAPDSLIINYVAVDTAGLDSVVLRVRGVVDSEHVRQLDLTEGIGERIALATPLTGQLGDSFVVEATAVDLFSKVTTRRRVVRIADLTWPIIVPLVDTVPHPELGPGAYPLVFVPGDTLRVSMTVTDDRALRFMGFQWLTFGDSATASGVSDSLRFEMVVPAGTRSADALLEFFAVDSSGNRSLTRIVSVALDPARAVRSR